MQILALIIWVAIVISLAAPTFMLLMFLVAESKERPTNPEPEAETQKEM